MELLYQVRHVIVARKTGLLSAKFRSCKFLLKIYFVSGDIYGIRMGMLKDLSCLREMADKSWNDLEHFFFVDGATAPFARDEKNPPCMLADMLVAMLNKSSSGASKSAVNVHMQVVEQMKTIVGASLLKEAIMAIRADHAEGALSGADIQCITEYLSARVSPEQQARLMKLRAVPSEGFRKTLEQEPPAVSSAEKQKPGTTIGDVMPKMWSSL